MLLTLGAQAVPVLNVSSLGNCAYVRRTRPSPPPPSHARIQAANMMHPAACPISEGSLCAPPPGWPAPPLPLTPPPQLGGTRR